MTTTNSAEVAGRLEASVDRILTARRRELDQWAHLATFAAQDVLLDLAGGLGDVARDHELDTLVRARLDELVLVEELRRR